MAVLVNAALGALAGVIAGLAGASIVGSKLALPIGILGGLVGYFLGGAIAPPQKAVSASAATAEWEDEEKAKKAKKAKKAAAEARKKEEAAEARAAEEAAKKAAKKESEKAKKNSKAPAKAAVAESDSDSDEDSAPKSKSALKKAKKAAKEAEAKKAAEAAAKKDAKKAKKGGAAAPAPAAAAAPVAAAKPAKAAAAASDLDGWETIEPSKPTKSQLAKQASGVVSPPVSQKKAAATPASERLLTEDIIVPVKQHALIIGTKGETLQKLIAGSGAEIVMPKRESASAKIQITGTVSQVQSAKNAIQSLADRGFSNITHPGILSDDINVEPTNIGLILGANGATLRTIQTKTGARINLPDKGSSSKKVTIVGEKEAVKAAKAALRSLITDGYSPLTHEGWVKLDIDFPAEKFGILIGPKGQTIKSIQGNTKTRINLPEKNSKATSISVCGLPAGVAQAEKEILRLLEPLAPLPDPEEEDLATDDAWGQEHTARGEDALWA